MSESKPKPITIRVPVTLLIPELDNIKHVSLQFTRALGPLNQGVPPTNGGAGWDTQNVVQINPAGPGTISINDQNQAAQRFVFSTADGMSTPTSAGRILVEVQAFLDTANPVDGQNLLVTLYHDLGKAGSGPIPSNLWVLGAQGEFLLGGAILGAAGVSQTLPNSQGGSTISIPFKNLPQGSTNITRCEFYPRAPLPPNTPFWVGFSTQSAGKMNVKLLHGPVASEPSATATNGTNWTADAVNSIWLKVYHQLPLSSASSTVGITGSGLYVIDDRGTESAKAGSNRIFVAKSLPNQEQSYSTVDFDTSWVIRKNSTLGTTSYGNVDGWAGLCSSGSSAISRLDYTATITYEPF